jgi:hypothetical protein
MAASGSPATPDAQAEWAAPYRVDLRAVLGSWVRGSGDPTIRLTGDGSAWRTSRTPDGPVTLRIVVVDSTVLAEAWGPGAAWQVAAVPDLFLVLTHSQLLPVEAVEVAHLHLEICMQLHVVVMV